MICYFKATAVLHFLQNFLTPLQGNISETCRTHSQLYLDTLNGVSVIHHITIIVYGSTSFGLKY